MLHLSRKSSRYLQASLVVMAAVVLGYLVLHVHAAGVVGDINNDGTVNVFDLSILLSDWGTSTPAADLNNDGTVNVFDLSILLSHWDQTGPTPTLTPTPTPTPTEAPVSAPFSWQTNIWCPNVRGTFGFPSSCSAVQAGFASGDAKFDPAQVSTNASGNVVLSLDSTGTSSGAFSTGGQETYSASPAGNTIQEQISGSDASGALPCSGSPAKIDNWPAFWMVTTGTWPAGGEIDIMEGLHGTAAWHYHFANAAGASSSVGGNYTNVTNCAGPVTYAAVWFSGSNPRIDFYANGVRAGRVTQNCTGLSAPCSQIDVPVVTGPMYLINNYENDNGTESGPLVNNVWMSVLSFSGTPD